MASIPMTPEQSVRAGLARHRAGRFDQAAPFYRRALAAAPEHPDALHLLGLALKELGEAREAARLIERAIARRPDNATFRFNLGVALGDAGDVAGAIAVYRELLARAPDHVLAHNNLGVELGRHGQLEAAGQAFREAIRLKPEFAEAHVNLAELICREGQAELRAEGEAAARRAIELAPGLGRAHLALANLLALGPTQAEAVAAARQAAALDPSPASQIGLADLLLKAGQPEQASEAATRGLALAADHPDLHCLLGTALLKLGQAQAALGHFRESLRLDPTNGAPTNALAVANMGIALSAVGRAGEAARLIDLPDLVVPTRLEAPAGYAGIDAFNQALAGQILAHSSLKWEPPGYVARRGALTDNLLLQPNRLIGALEDAIRQAVARYLAGLAEDPAHPFRRALARRYRMVIWAVVLESQGHLEPHIHERSWISGVYYVRLPEFRRGPDAGAIEFGRPANTFGYEFTPEVRLVRPEEGMIVLFPSSVYHRTVPFDDAAQRISVSFNCYCY